MKQNGKKSWRIVAVVLCVISIFTIGSCQIGLGASVDTAAPTVTIAYPPASAIIKGTFLFAGTCADDMGVTVATVTVTKVNQDGTNTSCGTYSAEIAEDGKTWSVSLNKETADNVDSTNTSSAFFTNYKRWDLADGTYELSITVSDAAGHSSGTSSRSIDVDNTAPVLIVSKPLGYGNGTATTYGQKLKLTGDIADAHTVTTLNMYVQQSVNDALSGDIKTLTSTNSVTGITMTEASPLYIAQYGSEDSSAATNYASLYGDVPDDISTAEVKKYYCALQLTDNAMTYNVLGDSGVSGGNTTSLYYIDTDTLDSTLLSDNSSYKLNATKIMNIINGTSVSSYDDSSLAAIKSCLFTTGNFAYSTSGSLNTSSSSCFSLNPNNSPSYTFSGYSISTSNVYADSSTGFRTYTNGATISLIINSGADLVSVKPRTVTVTLYKLKNNLSYSDSDIAALPSSSVTTLIAAGDWDVDPDTSVTKAVTISTVAPGVFYRLVVSGKDKNDNDIVAVDKAVFGYRGYSSTNPPEIKVTTTSGQYFRNTQTVTVKGTASFYASGSYKITCDAGTPSDTADDYSTDTENTTLVYDGTTWTDTVSLSGKNDTTSALKLTYTATDSLDQSTSAEFTYNIDTTVPVFTSGNTTYPDYVNKKAYADSNWYKSQTLPISGCWTEKGSGISEVYYQIRLSTDNTATAMTTENYATVNSGLFTTTDHGDVESYSVGVGTFNEGTSYLTLVAVDKAGNAGILENRIIKIDMEAPEIEADSVDAVMTNGKSDITINGLATDSTSGIDSVSVYIYSTTYTVSSSNTAYGTMTLTQTGDATINNNMVTLSAQKTRWTLLIDADGTTTSGWFNTTNLGSSSPAIYATVTDKAGNTTSKVRVSSLTIDTTAPVVTIKSPNASSTINGTHDVTGTVTETYPSKLQLFYRFKTVDASLANWTQYSTDVTSESSIYNWTFSNYDFTTLADNAKTLTDGAGTVYLLAVAYDKAGNSNIDVNAIVESNCTKYSIDLNSDRPTIKITNLSGNNTTLMYGDNASISGTVSDDDSSTTNGVACTFIAAHEQLTKDNLSATATEVTGSSAVSIPIIYYDSKNALYKTKYISVTPSTTNVTYKVAVTAHELTGYDITQFNPSTGDFTYIPGDVSDGSKSMYFYILDCPDTDALGDSGTSFYTGNTSTLYEPYVQFKTSTASDNTAAITYTSDSASPTISGVTVSYGSTTDASDATGVSIGTSLVLGGTNRTYAKFTITGKDASGIKAYTITVGSLDGSKTYTDAVSGDCAWTTDAFNLSTLATGTVTVTVTATDGAGLYSNSTLTFSVDNTAPTISITAPTTSTTITSTTELIGTASDGLATIDSIKYAIPLVSGTYSTTSDNWTTLTSTSSIDLNFNSIYAYTSDGTSVLYYADLCSYSVTGGTASTVYSVDAKNYYTDVALTTGYTGGGTISSTGAAIYKRTATTDDNVYNLPVYFLVTDKVGNTMLKTDYYMVVDIDAGRPTATIVYPSNADTIGGTVTIRGTATDIDGSISAVHVQIDTDGDADFDSTDYNTIDGWTSTAVKDALNGDSSSWYILATGTTSWKLELDTTKIATNTKIGIRVQAIDNAGNTRAFATTTGSSYICTTVDQNVPQITDLKVVQYASSAGGTTSKERTYTSNMYISNNVGTKKWYLTGTCTDDVKVASVKFTGSTSYAYTVSGTPTYSTNTDTKKVFYMALPTNTESGTIYTELSVTDDKGNESKQTITIILDNTAPSLYDTDDNEVTSTTTKLRLTHSSADIGSTNVIENDNYLYTFGDVAKDTGSGVSFIAFYFERYGSSVKKILCPMYDNYNTTYASSYVTIDTSITSSTTDGKMYVNDDGLACMYMSGTRTSTTSFTNTTYINSTAYNIRKGGLVKIGGIYTKITNVDTTNGIITIADEVSTSFTSMEVIFAQVVDHVAKESVKSDGYTVDSDTDDGDGMIETLTVSGSSYTWTASIQSDFITDGPIQIHAVAIDEAGNISNGYITTSVQNHRPRITKVLLGTDLNGNGTFDYTATTGGTSSTLPTTSLTSSGRTAEGTAFGEFSYYSAIATSGSYTSVEKAAQAVVTLGSSAFIVKDKMAIIPEFVGGNTGLKYTFTADSTIDSSTNAVVSAKSATTAITTVGSKWASDTTSNLYSMTDRTTLAGDCTSSDASISDQIGSYGGVVISANDLTAYESKTTTTGVRSFAFTFWDETDETTQGEDSQYALLKLPVIVDVTDGTVPTNTLTPFYWKNKNENSVTKATMSGGTTTYTSLGGHIDLGTTDSVSGTMRIEGTAFDDSRITELDMYITSYNMGNTASSTATTTGDTATVTVASLVSNVLTSKVSGFVIDSNTITQSGHTVTWHYTWNSALIKNVAANGVVITVSAKDRGSNSATADSETVNVVPYIGTVWTPLSEFNRSTPSIIARSAQGHYPVRAGDTVTVYGYNFGTSAKLSINGTTVSSTSASASTGTDDVTTYPYKITVPVTTSYTSGNVVITVNSVTSTNNSNSNDACGTYEAASGTGDYDKYCNYYNRLPNNANNNNLTDDCAFDVWEFATAATPKDGSASYVHMKVGPSGQIGFSYANAIMYFNMPGWTTTSKTAYRSQAAYSMNWGGYTQNNFTFDSNGDTYGVAECTDTAGFGSANVCFFEKYPYFTDSNQNNAYNHGSSQYYQSRIENTSVMVTANSITTNVNRVLSPDMATYTNGSNTYVYVAYYDAITKQIRFRVGLTGSTNPQNGLQDLSNLYTTKTSDAISPPESSTKDYLGNSTYAGYRYVHVLAQNGNVGSSTYNRYIGSTSIKSGQYVAVRALSNGTAVVAWYDATARRLALSYNTTPTAQLPVYSATTGGIDDYTNRYSGWKTCYISDANSLGWYVSMAVDNANGIHLAYYGASGADLYYTYIPYANLTSLTSSNYSEKVSTYLVDAYGQVGQYCMIDVGSDGTRQVPYITYQSSSYTGTTASAKIAHPLTAAYESNVISHAGCDSNEMFTGYWEISTLPTGSVPNTDTVSVGLSKQAGKIVSLPYVASPTESTVSVNNTYGNYCADSSYSPSSTNTGYAVCNASVVTGNYSQNPGVGYGISDGTIEFAQMR